MATNTNYTTKTAALKATKADVRQVQVSKKLTSKEVWIDDAEGKSTDVLELIGKAEQNATSAASTALSAAKTELEGKITAAQESAAISVGRDADTSWSVTEDEVTTGVKKINFMGAYVNVVPDGDTINLYIGENKNKASYSSITDTFDDSKYVYASSTSAWELPSDAEAGKTYARCSALSGTETIKLNNGAVIGNITSSQKIKVTVESDKEDTITYEAPDTISSVAGETGVSKAARLNDGNTYSDAPTTKTWEDANKGIKISASGMMKYTSADAKNGFTPESSCGVFSVTIDNDKVVGSKGGWYKVTVELGSTSKTTKMVYVYGGQTNTPSVGSATMSYAGSKDPRYVSGLAYDASGSFTLQVREIANTQQSITKDLNRATITKGSGSSVDFAATLTTSTATLKSGTTATNETAVYQYDKTLTASANTATIVKASVKVQAHGQNGAAGDVITSNEASSTNYLYTKTATTSGSNATDTGAKASFIDDTLRLPYAVLTDSNGKVTGLTITSDSWNSQKTIADSGEAIYKQALLVQDGLLKHPSQDSTKRYTSTATGKRYYVKKISTGTGTGAQTTYTISGSNLNNPNVKLWAVCANTDSVATAGGKAVLLNALVADGGVASSVGASSIKFTIAGAVMTCTPASAFYLVIEIANGATQTISPITVANA